MKMGARRFAAMLKRDIRWIRSHLRRRSRRDTRMASEEQARCWRSEVRALVMLGNSDIRSELRGPPRW